MLFRNLNLFLFNLLYFCRVNIGTIMFGLLIYSIICSQIKVNRPSHYDILIIIKTIFGEGRDEIITFVI